MLNNPRARLMDERNQLLHEFGHGPYRDGLVRDRIKAIEKEIERIPVIADNFRPVSGPVASLVKVIQQLEKAEQ